MPSRGAKCFLPCSNSDLPACMERRTANLRSITQLMSSPAVGDDVCDVPSEVAPALRRGQASLLKPRNSKIWSTEDGLSVIRRVRAQEQAQGLGIKAAVIVVEDLVEVVGTKEKLIGQLRGKCGIEHGRIVVHMTRTNLE